MSSINETIDESIIKKCILLHKSSIIKLIPILEYKDNYYIFFNSNSGYEINDYLTPDCSNAMYDFDNNIYYSVYIPTKNSTTFVNKLSEDFIIVIIDDNIKIKNINMKNNSFSDLKINYINHLINKYTTKFNTPVPFTNTYDTNDPQVTENWLPTLLDKVGSPIENNNEEVLLEDYVIIDDTDFNI